MALMPLAGLTEAEMKRQADRFVIILKEIVCSERIMEKYGNIEELIEIVVHNGKIYLSYF